MMKTGKYISALLSALLLCGSLTACCGIRTQAPEDDFYILTTEETTALTTAETTDTTVYATDRTRRLRTRLAETETTAALTDAAAVESSAAQADVQQAAPAQTYSYYNSYYHEPSSGQQVTTDPNRTYEEDPDIPQEILRTTSATTVVTAAATTTTTVYRVDHNAEMDKLIISYPRNCAVLLYRMDGSTLYSYQPDTMISGASLIKLPYAYYCCDQLTKGVRSLSDTMTYTSSWYHGGAGIIRKNAYGKTYTVAQLLDYAMRYSDNVAYDMLVYLFGVDGFNEMVASWGFDTRISQYTRFPAVTASFMKASMEKVQARADEGECWKIVWDGLNGSTSSYVRQALGTANPIAVKYGSIESHWHETCYISGDTPYILVILSGAVNYKADTDFLKKAALCAQKIVDAYEFAKTSETTTTTTTAVSTTETETTTTETTTTPFSESTTTATETSTTATTVTTDSQTTVTTTVTELSETEE